MCGVGMCDGMAAGNERGMRQAVGVGWWVGGIGGGVFSFFFVYL